MKLVIEHMPDESLMRRLKKERGPGRDDYLVRGMWNAVLAVDGKAIKTQARPLNVKVSLPRGALRYRM